jgi:hypothetical protein
MPVISPLPLLPPNLLQRAALVKKALGVISSAPAGAQSVPAASLWYENNTLYFVPNYGAAYPVAFASLAAFASYAGSVTLIGGAVPASVYPAPYSPQNYPGYGVADVTGGRYEYCFACSPGLAGVCVPAVQSIGSTWLRWSIESRAGIGTGSQPTFYMPPFFGPVIRGLPSTVQTLCSSGLTSVAIAYLLLGLPGGAGVVAGVVAGG